MRIPGYRNYTVSKSGEVINTASNHSMSRQVNNCGYHRVELTRDRKQQRFLVHRLVAAAYIPNEDSLPQVNHLNGDKLDNRVENLEWCTASQNRKHSFRCLGQQPTKLFDEDHPQTKVTKAEIPALVERKKTMTYRALGKEIGMHPKYLSKLLRGTVRG